MVGSVIEMPHPDVEAERARLAFFGKCLDEMRRRTESFLGQEDILAANEADTEAVRHQLELRLKSLDDGGLLCFGRIDASTPARLRLAPRGAATPQVRASRSAPPGPEIYYIGRRHVDDPDGDPVVVDWRAPVAIPFYRATAVDPQGLARRRRFTFAGRELADIFEEDFDDPESLLSETGAHGVPDPLLAELSRARTGQMRDIVATIQAEQDVVIRAALDECLVVQGGPGTGKTAVGLHRAAFLLYEEREVLARTGVLVLGPNRVFLEYISQVLPSLGETSVTQSTLDQLLGLRFRCTLVDPDERARLLGDARWSNVIRRAADEAIAPPTAPLELRFRSRVMRVDPARVVELIDSARNPSGGIDMPVRQQRERFRARLFRLAYDDWSGGELQATSIDEFTTEVLAHKESRAAVDRCWKTVNAIAMARGLLTSKATLARTAAGLFDAAEQRAILRRREREGSEELWSVHELPLLDEAEALIGGDVRRFGHVVVDEAQDYSPMALHMVARRALRGSMTILGDLAQATGPHPTTDWDVALAHLGRPAHARRAELTVGYRLPGAFLEAANRLLPEAAPDVTPARSAREDGDPPVLEECAPDALVARAVTLAHELTAELATVAVIAPRSLLQPLRDAGLGEATALGSGAVLLDAVTAKGLEFDGVIVVEPAAIHADGPQGPRLLFVALTRAVQHLVLLHTEPLPAALATR
jgi:DNA helicase IV